MDRRERRVLERLMNRGLLLCSAEAVPTADHAHRTRKWQYPGITT